MTVSPSSAPSGRARQPQGIPIGGQFAASNRGEASGVSLAGGSPGGPTASPALDRDTDLRARAALTVGDHMTSPTGTWEIAHLGSGDDVTLRLVERAETAPAHMRVGDLARTNAHNPTFTPMATTPEHGSVEAARTGHLVVVTTRGSGPHHGVEGVFGAQAIVGEHVQRRTWATGDPHSPYATVTVSTAATAVLRDAALDDQAAPLDSDVHAAEIRHDPGGVVYRVERVVEVSHHRDPEEPWARSADLPATRTRDEVVTTVDPIVGATGADNEAIRHAREIDWREYEPEITR